MSDQPIRIKIDTVVDDRDIGKIGATLTKSMSDARRVLGAAAREIDIPGSLSTLRRWADLRREAIATNKAPRATQEDKHDLRVLRDQIGLYREQERIISRIEKAKSGGVAYGPSRQEWYRLQNEAKKEARSGPVHGPSRYSWTQSEEGKAYAAKMAFAKLEQSQTRRLAAIKTAQHNEAVRETGYSTGQRVVMRTQDDGTRRAFLSDETRPRSVFDARYFQHRFGGQVGQIVTSTIPHALTRIVGGLAAAAGGRVSPTDALTDSISLDKAAVDLSNVSIVESDPENSTRVMPSALKRIARQLSNDTGFKAETVLGAISAHREISGSLQGSLKAAPELLRFAAVNAANPTDIMGLGGSLQAKLEERVGKEKAPEMVNALMRSMGQKGRIGAVEVPDMAKYGEQLIGLLPQTSQDFVGAFNDLVTMSQLSRTFGGSAAGAQAPKAVATMLSRLQTGAGRKEYKKLTGDDLPVGKLPGVKDMVFNMLEHAAGDPTKINKVFPGLIASRGPRGVMNPYLDAQSAYLASHEGDVVGAHRAGMAGAERAFAKFDVGQGSPEVAAQSLALVQATTQTQMERVNNAVGDAADTFNGEFSKAIGDAIPQIRTFAETLGGAATKALDSPGKTSLGLLGGAIGLSGVNALIGALVSGMVASLGALPVAIGAALTAAVGGVAAAGYSGWSANKTLQRDDGVELSKAQVDADMANAEKTNNPAALQRYLDRTKSRRDKIGADETLNTLADYTPGAPDMTQRHEYNKELMSKNDALYEKLTLMIAANTKAITAGIKVDVKQPVAPETPSVRSNNTMVPVP